LPYLTGKQQQEKPSARDCAYYLRQVKIELAA